MREWWRYSWDTATSTLTRYVLPSTPLLYWLEKVHWSSGDTTRTDDICPGGADIRRNAAPLYWQQSARECGRNYTPTVLIQPPATIQPLLYRPRNPASYQPLNSLRAKICHTSGTFGCEYPMGNFLSLSSSSITLFSTLITDSLSPCFLLSRAQGCGGRPLSGSSLSSLSQNLMA